MLDELERWKVLEKPLGDSVDMSLPLLTREEARDTLRLNRHLRPEFIAALENLWVDRDRVKGFYVSVRVH
jgi:hypothetical protein